MLDGSVALACGGAQHRRSWWDNFVAGVGDFFGFDNGHFDVRNMGLNRANSAAVAAAVDDAREAVGDGYDVIVVTGERARRGAVAFYNGWTERGRHTELAPSPSYYPAANAGIQMRQWFQQNQPLVRLGGAAQGVFGVAEGVVGIVGVVGGGATSEFGFGIPVAAGSAFLLWNGAGNAQAGFGTMWNGQPHTTPLQNVMTAAGVPQSWQGPAEVVLSMGAGSPAVMARTGVRQIAGDTVVQRGGAYRDVRGIDGYEAHHSPADSISPLSTGEGPSIAMTIDDHRLTASWGNSREARAYRQVQADLIAQGDFRSAQQMDIDDITGKFGNRYDDAIEQMLGYSRDEGHW